MPNSLQSTENQITAEDILGRIVDLQGPQTSKSEYLRAADFNKELPVFVAVLVLELYFFWPHSNQASCRQQYLGFWVHTAVNTSGDVGDMSYHDYEIPSH